MKGILLVTLLTPLIGAILNGFLGTWFKKKAHIPAVLAIGLSFLGSLVLFWWSLHHPLGVEWNLYTWVPVDRLQVPFGLLLDRLATIMLLVVTSVSLLVHIYSIGYMAEDPGYRRFFAYLNLFVFSMLLLVLANNFLLLFVGWEAVGLCSYLLIGFWYEKKSASDAGKKAFIVNRIGDAGFLLGIFTLFATFGTLKYTQIFEVVLSNPGYFSGTLITATLFLFMGAVGKSAQFPLYVWLPDAMEGPTPVSALIHAATMVTAGVYMVARSHPLFQEVPEVGTLVASIGAFTAIFAASIALVTDDIKRVLAYSTISQLGYMFVAVGLGAYTAGIFHLFTHAFFKGLLFLAAGSVMHATGGELNMQKMGGLWKRMPHTGWTFLIGALALSGIPPLAGFFSKDEILASAFRTGHTFIWAVTWFTAFLTALYMFRLIFNVFFGKPRNSKIYHHAHESPPVMTIPMWILAFLSVTAGWLGWGEEGSLFHRFLAPVLEHLEIVPVGLGKEGGLGLIFLSIAAGLAGIALAYQVFFRRSPSPERIAERAGLVYRLLKGKYYVDELYKALIVTPIRGLAVLTFRLVDRILIDGTVNLTGKSLAITGGLIRKGSTAKVRTYLLWILLGAHLFLWFLLKGR